MSNMSSPLKIIILSGGTGRTGEQVVKAALAQFDDPDVAVVVHNRVRTAAAGRKIVRQAKKDGAVLCQTLVSPKTREAVTREAEALEVPCVDILGPVITMLDDYMELAPRNVPGLSYEVNREQFDRIDAVDFTLAHDDRHRSEDLAHAHVVLVGVSRSSKSVTCFFLAYRGIRAANVPLIPDTEPPRELLELDPNKVIALTINPRRLQQLREVRSETWRGAMHEYTDSRAIARELHYANQLIAKHRWRSLDVSYKAVEEVAAEIVGMIGFDGRAGRTSPERNL